MYSFLGAVSPPRRTLKDYGPVYTNTYATLNPKNTVSNGYADAHTGSMWLLILLLVPGE
jgi:hypothetical protein